MKKLLAKLAVLGGLMGCLLLPALPALADTPTTATPFSTTAASGTIGPWTCPNGSQGQVFVTSGGGSTLTVKTAADSPFSAGYATNTTFGTAGVITTPGANTKWPGIISGADQYVEATFTGNSGTLSGAFICSGADAAGIAAAQAGTILAFNAVQILQGSGSTYYPGTVADTFNVSANITSATTTVIIPHSGSLKTFLGYLGVVSTGTNTTATYAWEAGSSSCTVGVIGPFPPQGFSLSPASGTTLTLVGNNSPGAAVQDWLTIAPIWPPIPIPANDDVCLVTTGAAVSVKTVQGYAQHA